MPKKGLIKGYLKVNWIYFPGEVWTWGYFIAREHESSSLKERRGQKKKRGRRQQQEQQLVFLHTLTSLLSKIFTDSPRWSWRRTWTPCYCSSSTSWYGSTHPSPSCPPTSSAGSQDLTGTSTAARRSGPRERRPALCWDAQRDPTERWAPPRGWRRRCIQEWTPWIRCLSMRPWGSHTGTV